MSKNQNVKRTFGIVKASKNYNRRIMVGIPTTGMIRMEWHFSQTNVIIPVNWGNAVCAPKYAKNLFTLSPMGFAVDHARNICVSQAIQNDAEWLLFIDHDTMVPPDVFIKFNQYMDKHITPIISGLYGDKSYPSTPLIFRGVGNHYFKDWKLGDKVWVDSVVMGCTMIHNEVLKALAANSPLYDDNEHALLGMVTGVKVWKVFHTPRTVFVDPETGHVNKKIGTEDLYFCDRIIEEKILEQCPTWKHLAGKKYPFITDTSILCTHIANDGKQYPIETWDIPLRNKKKRLTPSRL